MESIALKEEVDDSNLLQTIRIPKKLISLTDKLPMSNYEIKNNKNILINISGVNKEDNSEATAPEKLNSKRNEKESIMLVIKENSEKKQDKIKRIIINNNESITHRVKASSEYDIKVKEISNNNHLKKDDTTNNESNNLLNNPNRMIAVKNLNKIELINNNSHINNSNKVIKKANLFEYNNSLDYLKPSNYENVKIKESIIMSPYKKQMMPIDHKYLPYAKNDQIANLYKIYSPYMNNNNNSNNLKKYKSLQKDKNLNNILQLYPSLKKSYDSSIKIISNRKLSPMKLKYK